MTTIRVETKHIKHGRRCSLERCPIALAAQEQVDETTYVGGNCIAFNHGKFVADLPQAAMNFIRLFDTKQPVEPFVFEIEDIPEHQRHTSSCRYYNVFCGPKGSY